MSNHDGPEQSTRCHQKNLSQVESEHHQVSSYWIPEVPLVNGLDVLVDKVWYESYHKNLQDNLVANLERQDTAHLARDQLVFEDAHEGTHVKFELGLSLAHKALAHGTVIILFIYETRDLRNVDSFFF